VTSLKKTTLLHMEKFDDQLRKVGFA